MEKPKNQLFDEKFKMEKTKNQLQKLANDANLSPLSKDFALYLDSKDELKWLREHFHIPKMDTLPHGKRKVFKIFYD